MKVGGKSLADDQKENPQQVSAFRQVESECHMHRQGGEGNAWDVKFIPKQEGKGQSGSLEGELSSGRK